MSVKVTSGMLNPMHTLILNPKEGTIQLDSNIWAWTDNMRGISHGYQEPPGTGDLLLRHPTCKCSTAKCCSIVKETEGH